MNDFLQSAVNAHGGLKRWHEISTIKVAASITGAIWFVKSQGDYLKNIVMTVETRKEKMITEFPGQDKRFIFQPSTLVMERVDGTVIQAREDPENSFEGHQRETPWDDLHVSCFQGEALWTYLTTPFCTPMWVSSRRRSLQFDVHGESWRRLRVKFPDYIKSHTREQISCFGPDGLLRRHDYTVGILGGATGLNYASEYRIVNGIVFPTQRRIYAYEGDYKLVPEPLLVSIDMAEITTN